MGSDKTEEFAPADVVSDEPIETAGAQSKVTNGEAKRAQAVEVEPSGDAESGFDAGPAAAPRDRAEDMHNLLAALVEQARAMAGRMAGDPERETTCHFCSGPLPLWESLLVMQLAGVPAHLACPTDLLTAKLRDSGPDQAFPYEEFSAAVDVRLQHAAQLIAAGTIER